MISFYRMAQYNMNVMFGFIVFVLVVVTKTNDSFRSVGVVEALIVVPPSSLSSSLLSHDKFGGNTFCNAKTNSMNQLEYSNWSAPRCTKITRRRLVISFVSQTSDAMDLIKNVPSSTSHNFDDNGSNKRSGEKTTTLQGRRNFISTTATISSLLGCIIATATTPPNVANALDDTNIRATEITDTIYIDIKGLSTPTAVEASASSGGTSTTQRIVIGLYGKYAPNCVNRMKQLVSPAGLPALCKPKMERALQKEQLESNKVFNNCIDGQSVGVTLKYSSIWRIVPNERIDFGSVTGKFVAREYPNWMEDDSNNVSLKHDRPGVVSVRRGDTSGFGFTIYPGSSDDGTVSAMRQQLDNDHIIIGQVMDGMDIIQQLNKVPVIMSSKLNYMTFTGGPKTSDSPDRSCRYGGPMYCNENKPLIKLTITDVGIL